MIKNFCCKIFKKKTKIRLNQMKNRVNNKKILTSNQIYPKFQLT